SLPIPRGKGAGGKQGNTAGSQTMIEDPDRDRRPGRRVAQDKVQPVSRQIEQQLIGLIFITDELNSLLQGKCRLKHAVCDQLRYQVGNPDRQTEWPPARPSLEHIVQLAAETENFVG